MSVPPELMALLQGGGGDPSQGAAPQGDMSPAQMLEAAGGGAPAGPAPAAPAEEQAEGSPVYGGGGGPDALKSALDALAQYSQSEDDEQHVQTVLKCITALQAILAEEQKMSDGLMAGKADPRAMRRFAG